MSESVYLEDLLLNYHNPKNAIQCLFVELQERRSAKYAVATIEALLSCYFKGDDRPCYTRSQIMTYIREQVAVPRRVQNLCLAFLLCIIDTPQLGKAIGGFLGVEINKRRLREVMEKAIELQRMAVRINNTHLLPTRTRGPINQISRAPVDSIEEVLDELF